MTTAASSLLKAATKPRLAHPAFHCEVEGPLQQ